MFLKGITLANYGPFKNDRDGSFIITPYNRLKTSKDTLIDGKYLPLALVYGANNSGKSCLVSLLKELKIADSTSGYVNVPNKYLNTDGSLYTNHIFFDNYDFCMSYASRYKYSLKKGGKILYASDNIRNVINFKHSGKPLKEFLDGVYYLDESSEITPKLERFILNHLELVSSILRSADVFIERIYEDDEYGLMIEFKNGRNLQVGVTNTSIKKFLMLMPLFINESPYQVFVLDNFLDCFHHNLQEKILESHVLRDVKKQLIVTTNNPVFLHLIDQYSFLRRDEIYFIDSKRNCESSIVALSDFVRPKMKLDTEKDYLEGRFGGIPFVINLDR